MRYLLALFLSFSLLTSNLIALDSPQQMSTQAILDELRLNTLSLTSLSDNLWKSSIDWRELSLSLMEDLKQSREDLSNSQMRVEELETLQSNQESSTTEIYDSWLNSQSELQRAERKNKTLGYIVGILATTTVVSTLIAILK